MKERDKIFNQTTVLQGLVAGLLMALFLSFLSVTGEYGTGAVKYIKYLLLLGVIGYSLYTIRAKRNENQFLLSSIKKGFAISLIGGVVVTFINFLLFLYSPAYSIEKFNLAPEQLTELHLINAALIVEIVVIGLIGTFVLYQGLKYRELK